MLPPGSSARRLFVIAGLLAAALVACGRELVAPTAVPVAAFHRTGSLAIAPQYESPLVPHALRAALLEVAFDRVRITLRRDDGSVALDTVVLFPAGADSLTLTLNVPLPAATPSSGVPLSLNLGYVNAAGDTVFRGGPVPVTVVPTASAGGTPAPSAPVQVPVHYTGTGATAAAVVISPKSFAGTPGQSTIFTGRAIDAGGNTIAGTPIVFTSSNEGVVSVNANSGAATLVGRGTAKVYALLLTGKADSAVVSVTLPASQLALVGGANQTAPAGSTLPTSVSARVLANDGVGVAGTTVTFAASGGGTVTPASAVSDASGNVSTQWKLGPTAGAQTLSIAAAGLSGSPITVNATAQAITPTKLTVLAQPSNATAGSTLGTVSVAAQDAAGTTITTYAGNVSVALGANPGGATLSGTTTAAAVNGVATFTNLRVNRPGTGYTLVFSATDLSGATSSTFNITAGSAARLVFAAMPASVDAGIAIAPPVTVTAQDSAGNPVTSFTGAVTVAIGTNPGGATLGGTLTRNAVAGVATFDNLSINKSGAAYTLTAAATGLTSATSAAFNVAPGAATVIAVLSGGGQTAAAGSTVPVVLQVRDALGNGISGVTLTFAVTSGGGSLSASSGVTDASGQAPVTWTLGPLNGAQSMTASATGLPTTTVSATATGGSTNALAISTPPSATQTAGVTFSPTVVVQAKDALGAVVTSFTGAVTASVATGPSGATIGGTATVNAVAGVASFSALRLTKAGVYTIQFAASGYASATTTSITVTAAPAKTIAADSGNAQTGPSGAALPVKLVVLVTDSLGNPVSAAPVAWAVATGGGSLAGTTTATDANGRARATFTLGATPGAQSATATSSGLTGSPVTFTATAQGVIASTLVSPQVDTITAITGTFGLTAQARDAALNPMSGTFTWVSRNPAFATVSASGVVTAVANGSTYVVATESGGTKDSALIVVQQRLATINVNPATRNVYLGASHQFTASAVDGMGVAMLTQPSFTWSTTSGAIATANAATGVVTGTGLGTTQVRATSGAVTGTATINVVTPITRIVVSRDSAGFSTTANDAFTLSALGKTRSYRATARDTLDNVITGITFSWTSSNGAVATLDSINSTTVRATAAANGTSRITATAQGVSGAAALTVQQVLAKIHLTPSTASVAPTGLASITARGLDANNFFIPGGSFTFASSAPSIATVGAGTGVVTGVAPGSALITATSGVIGSDTSTVTVGTGVPATISFGRDTLTIGRSATGVSIPVYLSKPSASNVKILLAVADTSAYFSSASITIPAGSTSGNALLNGHNAATTQVTATDSAGNYTAGSAVLAVQASVRMANTYYYLNVTDQLTTQILLSDPAPAGGTYVTYGFGTSGIGTVSPSPAFIPAGQLAATVVVQATGAGNTTITPSASGASGIASTLYTYAATLNNYPAALRLGAGQYETYPYVSLPTSLNNSLAIGLSSSDTAKVLAPTGIVIPVNGSYSYYTISGKAPGSATVTSSAAGWTSGTTVVTVTTPKVSLCCGNSYPTTQPALGVTVYAEDSVGYSHARTSSLVVSLSSSDTSVLKVLTPTVTIPAGQSYTNLGSVIAGGATGTAKLYVSASGHTGDSTSYTFFGPPLSLSWSGSPLLGAGQQETYRYVSVPNNVLVPLVVTLSSSDSTKVAVPQTVTIPTGSNYVYFVVRGKTPGSVTISATAAGYTSTSAGYTTTSPRLVLSSGYTLNNFAPAVGFTAYAADSTRYSHYVSAPIIVTYSSTDTTVLQVTSIDTIQTGSSYTSHGFITPIGVGTANVVANATGFAPDTSTWTVQTPPLYLNFASLLLGRRQYDPNRYVAIPNARPVPVLVTLTQKHANVDSVTSTTLTIPANSNYLYFSIAGMATGTDTITATATDYSAVSSTVIVSTPKFTSSGLPSSATTTSPPSTVYVYATDSLGYSHQVLDSVLVKATTSNASVIQPTAAGFRFTVGNSYAQQQVAYVGPGSASMTYADSLGSGYQPATTNSVTVTGPSLSMYLYSPVLGMRQNGGASSGYVSIPNAIASPLTVSLVSTDTTVVTVPASVVIPAGNTYAYFKVTAHDVVGTIQIQATATGYGGTNGSVQVTQPKFVVSVTASMNTTSPPQGITVYATDANGTSHYTNEDVVVTLTSSSTATATVDSSTVTILANTTSHNTSHIVPVAQGTTVVYADDARGTGYAYVHSQSGTVAVIIPTLSLSNSSFSLGIGQYSDVYVYTPDAQAAGRTVNLSHFSSASTTPASVSIPTGGSNIAYRVTGATTGLDTVTASATGHNPVKGAVQVAPGHPYVSSWPSSLSLSGTDSVQVTLYAYDANNNWHYVASPTTFNLSGNSHVAFSNGSSAITSVVISADQYYATFWVKGVSLGTDASVQIAATNYVTQTFSVTVNP